MTGNDANDSTATSYGHALTMPAMTRRSYLELAPAHVAVPVARRHAADTITAWGLDQVASDAEVVVSELTTNAVHATLRSPAPRPVGLYLTADRDRLTVLVWDSSPEPPAPCPADDEAITGRGLQIVQALADEWGSSPSGGNGKVVWAWFSLNAPLI